MRRETREKTPGPGGAQAAVRPWIADAYRAGTLPGVQDAVADLRRRPGVLAVELAADTVTAGPAQLVRVVGPAEWGLALNVRVADPAMAQALRPTVDNLAAMAEQALRRACGPVPADLLPPALYYRVLVQAEGAAIVVVDPAQGWIPLSETFAATLGYDEKHPAGRLIELVHPEDRPAAVAAHVAACAGHEPDEPIALRVRTAWGDWRTLDVTVRSFIRAPDAGVVAYYGLDVTAWHEAERQAQRERSRLAILVDSLPDGILLLGVAGRTVLANNEGFRKLLGVAEPPAGFTGLSWEELIERLAPVFADPSKAASTLRSCVRLGRSTASAETALDDGRVLEWGFLPVVGEARPSGTLVHVRDMSARAAIERELRDRNRELAAATAANNQFIASAAHELRGPLSSVVAFVHMLGEAASGPLNTEQRVCLDIIDRNVGRLLRLIEDLLLLSRLESRALALRPTSVNLPELLRDAVAERQPAAMAAGVVLASDVLDGPAVTCDETRVHQVVGNLVGNAIKFTPAGGVVTVYGRPEGGGWRVEVRDTGVGIPADDLPRLFSAFFRAGNATAAGGGEIPGAGLGLVVSRLIVERHGGSIHVTSTEGEGTTVSVWLPAHPPREDGGEP